MQQERSGHKEKEREEMVVVEGGVTTALQNYGKLVEATELADVVLVVEGERFPVHRLMLTAWSEYFRGLLVMRSEEEEGEEEDEDKERDPGRLCPSQIKEEEQTEVWESV